MIFAVPPDEPPSYAETFVCEPPRASQGPSELELLARIIECESGFDEKAQNPHSSAKGLFQIVDGTWQHFECQGDPLNGKDNFLCGVKIYLANGTKDWNASRKCWDVVD